MTDGQYSLLNTRGMTSTREMRAFKRAAEIKRLGIKRAQPKPPKRYKLPNYCHDVSDMEFAMADEDRTWTVLAGPCPGCGNKGQARLERKTIRRATWFRVKCALSPKSCTYQTPWLKSSAMAIQHWRVTAALSR